MLENESNPTDFVSFSDSVQHSSGLCLILSTVASCVSPGGCEFDGTKVLRNCYLKIHNGRGDIYIYI